MATIRRFEEIEAWQLARELARRVYALPNRTGLGDDRNLRIQVRRAVASVMAYIAEGFERDGRKEFAQFCRLRRDLPARP